MNYADWPLAAPVNLTWEITHQCNLSCVHCLSNSGKEQMNDELTLDECRCIVDQLDAAGVFEINFGGGEPLLHHSFVPLLEYIHTKGIVTCISTNGTLLTEQFAGRFENNPLVQIQVSLDGATPEVNDRIRGSGSFRSVIKGIHLLAERKIGFSINAVVTSVNFGELERLRELACSLGANLRVSRFRPAGRGKSVWDELRLNALQLRDLSAWLTLHPHILTGDSFFSISNRGRRDMGLDLCGACKLTCCVDPCGSLYPCAFLQEDEFCAGNLRTTPFTEIWRFSSIFHKFRELESRSCRKCSRFGECRGGCPAVARFVTRDLNSADPECLIHWTHQCDHDSNELTNNVVLGD